MTTVPTNNSQSIIKGTDLRSFGYLTQQVPQLFASLKLETTNFAINQDTSNMQNNQGQGISHATGSSKVPQGLQERVPQGLEESLPNKVHDTGSGTGRQTHALNEGEDSIVPKGIQKAVPERVERALPNKIHNTGDE